ncbi:GNAT family N-acetyltransferase [uncultured Sphingomonas sp.]|uniref:GNAT family N-acetyltransferase n=1 Tax=uncultured Sphingomonas sp. TaxID=158754 RepID=UPI0035CABC02
MPDFIPLASIASDRVEALLDGAFGPERRKRTAYAIRGSGAMLAALSFAATDGDALVGTIQCWPVELGGDDNVAYPLAMVGPVAVAPDRQRGGLGRRLVTLALEAARRTGDDRAMMLIGDSEYYGRFFGFTADRTADWRLPGPVERRRLLARGPAVPAVPGMLGPRRAVGA